jgi:SRSO17 transposase
VSRSIANHHASLPVTYRLYLPKEWTEDRDRRRKVGIPAEVDFLTKPEKALEQLRWACTSGLPRGVVLMDAGYGNNGDLRTEITALGLTYVAGLLSSTTVWAPGTGPCRRSHGRAAAVHRNCCAATVSISRPPSRRSRSACQPKLGAPSRGGKERTKS